MVPLLTSCLVLIDTDLVYRCEGIRVLLQVLAEGPHELGPSLANVFLTIIDSPRTRVYLKPQTDLEVCLSLIVGVQLT